MEIPLCDKRAHAQNWSSLHIHWRSVFKEGPNHTLGQEHLWKHPYGVKDHVSWLEAKSASLKNDTRKQDPLPLIKGSESLDLRHSASLLLLIFISRQISALAVIWPSSAEKKYKFYGPIVAIVV